LGSSWNDGVSIVKDDLCWSPLVLGNSYKKDRAPNINKVKWLISAYENSGNRLSLFFKWMVAKFDE